MRWIVGVLILLTAGTEAGRGDDADPWSDLPAGFPRPRVPIENPLTISKVELGRHLFFDRRLSADGTMACASCHEPLHGFTDGLPRAVGVTGEIHPRSAMTLTNVAYNATFNWADRTTRELEEQMLVPMFSLVPVEMGISGREAEVLARLEQESRYAPLFEAAFPEDPRPIRFDNVVRAIASFERTLISGNSAYDRYVYWDERAGFPESAHRGMRLFFSTKVRCAECHTGFNFSGPVVWRDGPEVEPVFHNTALYDSDGAGAYPADNPGLYAQTGSRADMGQFRAPTLRNIAVTAPYMHDGSIATLEEVIDTYAAGGRAPHSPLKSDRLVGFSLTPTERADLVSFLESLTDESFLHDPRHSDPWPHP